jgi:hypothetical protein
MAFFLMSDGFEVKKNKKKIKKNKKETRNK